MQGFEIYECIRKLALVCMPVLFEPGTVGQLLFGLMICFATFGAYTKVAPYSEPRANVLAQACQVQIFFTLLSSIALKYDAGRTDQSERNMDLMLTILFFLPLSITLLLRTPLKRLLDFNERAKLDRKLRRRLGRKATATISVKNLLAAEHEATTKVTPQPPSRSATTVNDDAVLASALANDDANLASALADNAALNTENIALKAEVAALRNALAPSAPDPPAPSAAPSIQQHTFSSVTQHLIARFSPRTQHLISRISPAATPHAPPTTRISPASTPNTLLQSVQRRALAPIPRRRTVAPA